MQAFVISLQRCADRRSHMARTLSEAGIEFTFWDATEGAKLSSPEIEQVINQEAVRRWSTKGMPLKPGEIGCAISHIRLWRHLVASKTDKALILEDDIIIRQPEIRKLLTELEALPPAREVILLNSNQSSTWIRNRRPVSTGETIHYANGKANLTSAYIITLDAAKALLHYLDKHKLGFPIDCWCSASRPSFSRAIKTRVVLPNPIVQIGDKLPSTITAPGTQSKRRPIKRTLDSIRNAVRSLIPPA